MIHSSFYVMSDRYAFRLPLYFDKYLALLLLPFTDVVTGVSQ